MASLLKRVSISGSLVALVAAAISCSSTPGDDKGPHHTTAFYIQVQASSEGVSIETNHVFAGKTPLIIKVLGNQAGMFHNFGSPQFVVRALPESTNAFTPTQVFQTGTKSSPGDRIPGLIFFDMNSASGSFSVDSSARK